MLSHTAKLLRWYQCVFDLLWSELLQILWKTLMISAHEADHEIMNFGYFIVDITMTS